MSDTDERPRRLTRAQAKEATRRRLLDAAAEVFARKGFAAASVEEIAAAAGYTIGALYAHFGSKQQLFLELLSQRRSQRAERIVAALREAEARGEDPLARLPSLLATQDRARANHDGVEGDLQAEFWLYAARNPETRTQLAEQIGAQIDTFEPLFTQLLAQRDAAPEVAPRDVTLVAFALLQGLLRQRRIDPSRVPDELLISALRWLLDGIPTRK